MFSNNFASAKVSFTSSSLSNYPIASTKKNNARNKEALTKKHSEEDEKIIRNRPVISLQHEKVPSDRREKTTTEVDRSDLR